MIRDEEVGIAVTVNVAVALTTRPTDATRHSTTEAAMAAKIILAADGWGMVTA
jgi:hypothetical protein